MFSKQDFENYLKEKWKENRFIMESDERVGLSVSDIVAHSKERNDTLESPYLDLWVGIFDEQISWLISLNDVFFAEV